MPSPPPRSGSPRTRGRADRHLHAGQGHGAARPRRADRTVGPAARPDLRRRRRPREVGRPRRCPSPTTSPSSATPPTAIPASPAGAPRAPRPSSPAYGHLEDVPDRASTWEVPGVSGARAMTLAASLRDHMDEALLYRDLARLRTADDGVKIRQTDPDELRWDGAPRPSGRPSATSGASIDCEPVRIAGWTRRAPATRHPTSAARCSGHGIGHPAARPPDSPAIPAAADRRPLDGAIRPATTTAPSLHRARTPRSGRSAGTRCRPRSPPAPRSERRRRHEPDLEEVVAPGPEAPHRPSPRTTPPTRRPSHAA